MAKFDVSVGPKGLERRNRTETEHPDGPVPEAPETTRAQGTGIEIPADMRPASSEEIKQEYTGLLDRIKQGMGRVVERLNAFKDTATFDERVDRFADATGKVVARGIKKTPAVAVKTAKVGAVVATAPVTVPLAAAGAAVYGTYRATKAGAEIAGKAKDASFEFGARKAAEAKAKIEEVKNAGMEKVAAGTAYVLEEAAKADQVVRTTARDLQQVYDNREQILNDIADEGEKFAANAVRSAAAYGKEKATVAGQKFNEATDKLNAFGDAAVEVVDGIGDIYDKRGEIYDQIADDLGTAAGEVTKKTLKATAKGAKAVAGAAATAAAIPTVGAYRMGKSVAKEVYEIGKANAEVAAVGAKAVGKGLKAGAELGAAGVAAGAAVVAEGARRVGETSYDVLDATGVVDFVDDSVAAARHVRAEAKNFPENAKAAKNAAIETVKDTWNRKGEIARDIKNNVVDSVKDARIVSLDWTDEQGWLGSLVSGLTAAVDQLKARREAANAKQAERYDRAIDAVENSLAKQLTIREKAKGFMEKFRNRIANAMEDFWGGAVIAEENDGKAPEMRIEDKAKAAEAARIREEYLRTREAERRVDELLKQPLERVYGNESEDKKTA